MNKREKTLAGITFGIAGLLVALLLVDKLLLAPSEKLDQQIRNLRRSRRSLRAQNAKRGWYVRNIRDLMARTYGHDENQVAERVRSRLLRLLQRSKLSSSGVSMSPVSEGGPRGVYRALGQSIRASGRLQHVVNFLFLLSEDPHLHRIENCTLTRDNDGEMRLSLKYYTLLIDQPDEFAIARPDTQPTTAEAVTLNSPRRDTYEVITSRDLWRPYIKRPPRPPKKEVARRPPPKKAPPRERPKPPPPDSRFRVVDLSQWGGEPEALVLDTRTKRTARHEIGDELAGGKIAMIDYRQMPRPDEPEMLSPSRLILKIGPEYWAVELGQRLSDRRRLKNDQLPEGLKAPTTAPAGEQQETDGRD